MIFYEVPRRDAPPERRALDCSTFPNPPQQAGPHVGSPTPPPAALETLAPREQPLLLVPSIGLWLAALFLGITCLGVAVQAAGKTEIEIRGEKFFINGRPTYSGRIWNGHSIEGLLFNARMVQGIFDDRNPETIARWSYPDTQRWDAERNAREFIAAMPSWRKHGLLAFTLNLQGGSPEGYSKNQPWHNSALNGDGSLRDDALKRLRAILREADRLGMAVIVGLFYFGQDQRLRDETAIRRATTGAVDWLLDTGHRNLLLEINNECDVRAYDHDILKPDRVHELIELSKTRRKQGRRLLVGTSYGGGTVPRSNVIACSDFILLHGNGVSNPEGITDQVRKTRGVPGYRPMPIVYNEDDHFAFDQPRYNLLAAVESGASWGYFDFRMAGEGFHDGFQSVPVDWTISSPRKKAFFERLAEITGSTPTLP